MKGLFKSILLFFAVIFTAATLFSSIVNLALGYETDTYMHIIDRAVLTLIGSIVINLALKLRLKNKFLNFFLPYAVFILLAMLYVFISGLYQELHPNAYRDVFLNDTIAYLVVYACLKVYEKIKRRKS